MIIHKVQLNDTGNYTCVASTNQSSVQEAMSLTVKPNRHSSDGNEYPRGKDHILIF